MELQKQPERRQKRMEWFYFITMLLCFIVFFTGQFARVSIMVYRRYIPMLVWSIMAIAIYRGDYKLRSVYGLGLGFLGWYVITRIILGDYYLNTSYNFFIELCVSYGFMLPFAMLVKEGTAQKFFDILALLFVLFTTAISIGGIVCAIRREPLVVPYTSFVFQMDNYRLWPLGLNPNVGGPLLNCGTFLAVYLMARYKRKWQIAAVGILFVLNFAACSLTVSRGALIGRSVGFAIIAILLAGKIRINKKGIRVAVTVLLCVAGFVVSYKATDVTVDLMTAIANQASGTAAEVAETANTEGAEAFANEDVAASRSTLNALGTLSSRTYIYKQLFQVIRDDPRILLLGTEDGTIMNMMGEYQSYLTLHNAYLQVLALTGVVGIVLILVFCLFVFLAALKLLLDTGRPLAQRVLPIIMVPLVLQAVTESILFVPWTTLGPGTLINFIFLISAGYTIEMACGLTFKELFQRMK